MSDTQLYSQILGIAKPWKVTGVQVSLADDEVEVVVAHGGDPLVCRQCNPRCPGYDKRAGHLAIVAKASARCCASGAR